MASASAQEESLHTQAEAPEVVKAERILVNGQNEDFVTNTVTPQRLSKEKMDLYKFTDVNRALKQTTGVYVREEDGQGLRPNIGLRGTNPDRSKKIVFLEDGVLIGPAPYSAPAAYYTPAMNHTETLDVYKGFTAVPYGPNSIGGTIDYISTSVPGESLQKIEASTGAFNTQNIKIVSGNSYSNGLSYVVNASHFRSDGFKKIDGGGDAGFFKNDVVAKLKVDLPKGEALEHSIEAKLAYADEDSNETYMGLAWSDLAQSPYRRYASSAQDKMQWMHTTAQITHNIVVSENVALKSQVYRHDFDRTWARMDRFAGNQAPSLFDVLTRPDQNQTYFNIINGTEDSSTAVNGAGDLIQAQNQRTYYSQGVQVKLNTNFQWGITKQDSEVGLRFHQDQIRRNHTNLRFEMLNGSLAATGANSQEAMNSNKAEAVTAHMIHNVSLGRWVFTGIARAENVKYNFNNTMSGVSIKRDDQVFAPGAAVLLNVAKGATLKASVNRGVSVAGLNDDGSEAQERSVNYELGFKFASDSGKSLAEVVGFYNDYSNITGTCTASTGCTNTAVDLQFNGGQAAIQGIEARVAHSIDIGAVTVPLQLNTTLLNAEFRNDFTSGSAEWGLGQVLSGDPLPYVPQVQYTFTVGANYKNLTQEMAFIYQGESQDQSARAGRQTVSGYGIVDWTGRYAINKNSQVFARMDNLLGKDYVVSLRPFGARPGKPQSFMVGLSYQF
ncbi:MAG: TonB-dependent receptor [Bdellovibrionaceae bacterium]|nr:TonB-dependent receptor [Pseudobdellovibrionaceae bacterium]